MVGARAGGCKLLECRPMRSLLGLAAVVGLAGCLEPNAKFEETDASSSTGAAPEETTSGTPPPPTSDPQPGTTTTTTDPVDPTTTAASTTASTSMTSEPGETSESSASGETSEPGETGESSGTDTGMPAPECGNGVVEDNEACDDGNPINEDMCKNDCTAAVCGDGYVQDEIGEACDDANNDDSDGCIDCVLAKCGDGVLWTMDMKEACDDGNLSNSDGCLATCVEATCGDSFVYLGTEGCDDGNGVDYDLCSSTCKPTPMHVFATSTLYTGVLGGLPGADTKCSVAAFEAGLPGTYKAWLSDNTQSAGMRITPGLGTYIRTDGLVVADTWAAFKSGLHELPIDLNEFGLPAPLSEPACGPGIPLVWTNSNADGTTYNPMYDCMNWSSASGPAAFGRLDAMNFSWSLQCGLMAPSTCGKLAPLYCVQEPL